MTAHIAVVGILLLQPGLPPAVEEIEVPLVQLVAGDGAAGSAGGQAGSGAPAAIAPAEILSETPAELRSAPAPVVLPRPPRARPQPRPQTPPAPVVSERPQPAPVPAPTPAPVSRPALHPGTAATGSSPSGPGGAAGGGQGSADTGASALGKGEGPGDDYFERLRRHLAKHKRYPPEASRQKQEGKVQVKFTLARDGTVLAAEIERGSGFPLLDQAVLDMLREASPVPSLPERFAGERIQISLPIDFSLGFFTRLF